MALDSVKARRIQSSDVMPRSRGDLHTKSILGSPPVSLSKVSKHKEVGNLIGAVNVDSNDLIMMPLFVEV